MITQTALQEFVFSRDETIAVVDKDPDLHYEVNHGVYKFLNFLWLAFANFVPVSLGTFLFANTSRHTRDIKRLARSHHAIEMLYQYSGRLDCSGGYLDGLATFFWEHAINNAKAARNRLKLVRREIIAEIMKRRPASTKIVSLATGSSRSVLEAISKTAVDSPRVSAVLIDRSKSALDFSADLAKKLGVSSRVKIIRNKIETLDFSELDGADIVEMVGIFEYLNDDIIIDLLGTIRSRLSPRGVVIYSNARKESESRFVEKVIGWPRILRSGDELVQLASLAGFEPQNIRLLYEPLKIQGIIVATS